MAQNLQQWSVDDVSKWLESLHLYSLIPIFERYNISGVELSQMDDAYMRESLRITKPGEVAALKGAISSLIEQAPQKQNKRVSAPVRERSGSLDKQKTYPQMSKKISNFNPTTMPRNFTISGGETEFGISATREPRLKKDASAPDVLDDKCRYSGWIIKQGGGYKNWRRRYLVLRLGCLYYFANETAKEAKGCFTLAGYRTEICMDPEILKKHKWTLKVEPTTSSLRTYYMSVGAKRELYAWKQAIDEEIVACARRPRSDDRAAMNSVGSGGGGGGYMTTDDVGEVAEGSSEEEGDDDEPIYDQPDECDEDFNGDGIYDRPDEDDDPYSEITEEVIGVARLSPTSTQPLHPTLPGGKGVPLAVKSFKGINDWELAPEHRILRGKGGAPTVPMRSPFSLGLDQKQGVPPPAAVRSRDDIGDDTYLSIIGSGPADSTPLSGDRNKLYSPPHHPVTSIAERPELDRDYEDDRALEGDDYGGDDNDPYYIMIRKPEELMPPSCLFDNLDRSEADRLLRAKSVNGTYLIRAGSHAGSEKVLSVWHDDRCRHYKLFKDENSQYSLTQGRTFTTIPELLQNYWNGDYLPRCEFHLTEPFYPDH